MRSLPNPGRALGLLLATLLVAGAPLVRADRESAFRLAPVMMRVLPYERTLTGRAGGSVDVLVLHAASSASAAEARGLEEAITAMRIPDVQGLPLRVRREAYSAGGLATELTRGVDVLVLSSGLEADVGAIADTARRGHVLTIGSTRAFAEHGAEIAVFMQDGRPRIAVNMAQVRAAGTQLSSQLLRLCDVL